MFSPNFSREPDRVDKNESDGMTFYGFDRGDGVTDWYTADGRLDSYTDTPSDDR